MSPHGQAGSLLILLRSGDARQFIRWHHMPSLRRLPNASYVTALVSAKARYTVTTTGNLKSIGDISHALWISPVVQRLRLRVVEMRVCFGHSVGKRQRRPCGAGVRCLSLDPPVV